MSQLHERRVVDFTNLIASPVVSWGCGIQGIVEDARGLSKRADGSCLGETVVHDSTEGA